VANGFELTGFEDMMGFLRNMGEAGKRIEKKALESGAEIIRSEIESNTPKSQLNKEHAKEHIVIGEIKNGIIPIGPDHGSYYLRFPEFGTSTQPAQGFMERAFNNKKVEAQRAIADVVRDELGL
jgi:HK97 gp10 family phage protein